MELRPTVHTVDMRIFEILSAAAGTNLMSFQPHPNTINVEIVITGQIAMRLHLLANSTFVSHQTNILGEVEVQQLTQAIVSLYSQLRDRIVGLLYWQDSKIMGRLHDILNRGECGLLFLVLFLFVSLFPPLVYRTCLAA
jgi:hypothetical protein